MKYGIAIFMAVSCALCCYALFGCKPNTRFFTKENIRLTARLRRDVASFGVVQIGSYDKPYEGKPKIFVKWDSGVIVRMHESKEAIQYILSNSAPKQASANWDPSTVQYTVPPCIFHVLDDAIIAAEVSHVLFTKPNVSISSNGQIFYKMPLSEKDVRALFGDPSSEMDTWIH